MAMYDNVPPELKARQQWVGWQYVDDPEKDRRKKVPFCPTTGQYAESNNPETWGTFEQAVAAVEAYQLTGIGIMFADGIFGVDIDHCIDPDTGAIDPAAAEIIATVRSYTELSPSRTGIHILCYGTLPSGRRRKGDIEMYSEGRYFTVTGELYGEPYPFDDCTDRIKAMHAKYLGEDPPPVRARPAAPSGSVTGKLSIDQLLQKAFASKEGDHFQALYEGSWATLGIGDGSQSSADQAFCNRLAFWTGCDSSMMDTIFRQSGLMRAKWDTRRGGSTYGARTIAKAIRDCPKVYEPPQERPRKARKASPAPSAPPVPLEKVKDSPSPDLDADAPKAKDLWFYSYDDTGNAQRFRDTYLGDIRYNHIDGQWLCWEGSRWRIDETGEIKRRADAMLERMAGEVARNPDRPNADVFRKHISRSRSSKSKKAMIEEAKHLEGVPILPADLDRHGNALNVKNCIINLRKGTNGQQLRRFLLTRMAPVEYRPEAKCPTWDRFLRDVTNGDAELILYLQRMAGYCLTASTREQCVFFLYGNGSNGKSTFVDVLASMMGDYAATCQPETVMMRDRNNTARFDLARLKGARLVTTSEPNEGCRLDEGIVKQMAGGTNNKLVARFLYGREFEFVPEFKIIMSTNHKPVISGTDNGIWRRVRMIPFTAEITEDRKDKQLPDKLRAELSGILNWTIQGAVDWHRHGLPPCAAVDAAGKEYRSEMDRIQQFVDDCLVSSADGSAKASNIYLCYKEWCSEQGNRYPINANKFFSELVKYYEKRKTTAFNEYVGVTFSDHGWALYLNLTSRKSR